MMGKKTEREFLEILEDKAKDQKRLIRSGLLPNWAGFLGAWLAVNPWRVITPLAGIMYVILRLVFGEPLVEGVLGLFGGFNEK